MRFTVYKAAIAFFITGVASFLAFQNCVPVQVSDFKSEDTPLGTVQSTPQQNCEDVGKSSGDTWWVPNGNSRDVVACTTGNGSQFKIYDEEAEAKCDDGRVSLTGQTRRTFVRTEGLCNLDCGDHKNGDKWWNQVGISRDQVQCTVGTGTQFKVFKEEVEYQCTNTMVLLTGNKRRTDTNTLEGQCNLDCGTDHKNGDHWWVPGTSSKQAMQCTVGTGTQYKLFDSEIEYACTNAVAALTGNTRQIDTGKIEGTCNLDCDTHKNNDLWWMDIGNSTETKRCATALNVNSTVTYKNEAEYKCMNAITGATGNTKKTVLSETQCPPLTFNNQDNIATVAYEDIYPGPGDADYNDFVANIKVQETYNSLEQLTKIQLEYTPRLKLAGYFAQFVLVFDGHVRGRNGFVSNVKDFVSLPMFEGNASIKLERYDSAGNLTATVNSIPKDQDLILFDDTSAAVNNKPKVVITITNLDPTLNTLSLRNGLSIKRYRTVLFVTADTGKKYDVELSDINPTMFDSLLQPLAFFVPVNWKPPGAQVNILKPYPLFKDHSAYLYSNKPLDQEPSSSREWYNTLADPTKVISQ